MSGIFSLIPIFDWVVFTSAKVSVLIIFLLLLKCFLRNKLGALLNYLLWAVVLIGLLLPWTPQSSLSIANLGKPSLEGSTAIIAGIAPGISRNIPVSTNNKINANHALPDASESQPQSKTSLSSLAASPFVHRFLFILWISGMLSLTLAAIVVNKRFSRSSKGRAVNNWYLLVGLESAKNRLNIKRDISLRLTPALGTPALFGLLRPKLLLPESVVKDFSLRQLNYIFVHELFHLKRRDLFVNWLAQGLLIVHWFNPLIWCAFRKLREDQEIACDALTVKYFGTNEAKDYGHTLLRLLEDHNRIPGLVNMAGLSSPKSLIKRRIISIRKRQKGSLAFTIFIVGIVILTSFVTLAKAKGAESKNLALFSSPNPSTAKQAGENQTAMPFPDAGQMPYNLPASVRLLSVSDDSPAGVYWSPNRENIILSQISAWLKNAKPYTPAIPAPESVDAIVHHNIGPSVLHLTGSDGFQTLLYPAWYTQINGREVDAQSLGKYIHYVQDVVILVEAKTNKVNYLESGPLYNWLKNGEWKGEFSPDPALPPQYQSNEKGQTYGSNLGAIMGDPQPDLIAALGANGTSGYVRYEDLMGEMPKTPEEALALQNSRKPGSVRQIPLYAADGKTVIGVFPSTGGN